MGVLDALPTDVAADRSYGFLLQHSNDWNCHLIDLAWEVEAKRFMRHPHCRKVTPENPHSQLDTSPLPLPFTAGHLSPSLSHSQSRPRESPPAAGHLSPSLSHSQPTTLPHPCLSFTGDAGPRELDQATRAARAVLGSHLRPHARRVLRRAPRLAAFLRQLLVGRPRATP